MATIDEATQDSLVDPIRSVGPDATADFAIPGAPDNPTEFASNENLRYAAFPNAAKAEDDDALEDDEDEDDEDEDADDDLEDDDDLDEDEEDEDDLEDDDDEDEFDDDDEDDDEEEEEDNAVMARS